jgi:hypothetical protein
MGYYMRFLSTDERPITIREIRLGVKANHPDYSVTQDGFLTFGSAVVASIEINTPADELFGEEIQELTKFARDYRRARNFPEVADCLNCARTIVAVQVMFNDLGENALDTLAPLWNWLFENRTGLLQADGEGFWRGSTLILRAE